MPALQRLLIANLIAGLATTFAVPAPAQEKTPATKKAAKSNPETKVDPRLQRLLRSPRSTMQTLLNSVNENDLERAAECLDFSGSALTSDAKASAGGRLAFKLKETIDRMMQVDPAKIPDDADAPRPYRLAYQNSGMEDKDISDAALIVIKKSADGLWRFSAGTVTEIEILYDRWQSRERVAFESLEKVKKPFSIWLEEQFPEDLKRTRLLFPDYQWLCILALIFVGFVVDLITRFLLNVMTNIWFKLRHGEAPPERKKLWKPVGLLAQAVTWYTGTTLIGLPPWALSVLLGILKLFAVLAAVWTAFRFIDVLTGIMKRKADRTETKFDDLLIPLISKSLKVFVVCIGVVIGAETFNFQITGLLAGVGIGGMALALASKDAVSNLFGSATVLLDRPFEVGDWIVTSDVEGTVETVGFRSTRVRTFYNSLVTVPNSNLTTAVVDNLGKRTYRRIKTMLGLQYDTTPEQIDAFCEGIRELLRRHPYSRKDSYHVYLNQFNTSSLDVLLYCFLQCPDWSVELRERHRLFIDILKLADELKISFAFPTQTLHMFQESHPDDGSPPLGEPQRMGRRAAADIAGPLLSPKDRPGSVEFRGPSEDA